MSSSDKQDYSLNLDKMYLQIKQTLPKPLFDMVDNIESAIADGDLDIGFDTLKQLCDTPDSDAAMALMFTLACKYHSEEYTNFIGCIMLKTMRDKLSSLPQYGHFIPHIDTLPNYSISRKPDQ